MTFFRTSILVICLACLFVSSAQALNLPFLNGSAPIDLRFTSPEHETLLRPQLEIVLLRERQNQALAEYTFTLQKQARLERDALNTSLRSEGFYAATISYVLKEQHIVYTIAPGPRYTLRQVRLTANVEGLPSTDALGLIPGEPFRAQAVLDAQNQLRQRIEKQQCLWQVEVSYDATVFHDSHTADLTLSVADSQTVSFADITIAGQKTLDEAYLKRKLGFQPGDCFKRSTVDKARLNLYQSGLLASVESTLERSGDQVAVHFDVVERKQRTVKAGAGYSSDEGPYLSTGWEHRNIFGEAEKLEFDGRVSDLYQTVDARLTIPEFYDPRQTLILGAQLAAEQLEAFDSDSLEVSATLKRKLDTYLTGSLGTRYQLASVDDMGDEETFGLWSFPMSLSYDRRNDPLNPTRGWFLSGGVEPFLDTLDTGTYFFKTTFGGSAYHTLPDWAGTPTLAARAAFGTINGQSIDDIPPGERFYAGGGGSVRGYGYQLLGPLDADDEPVGGRSFAEVSLETRWNLSPKWGAVIFADGGNAYESITPSASEGLRWAVGAGARYFTDFAPIRVDVAFPLDRRDGVDDSFQFYISIGQAF